MEFDLFISHANEDKSTVVRPLVERLTAMGLVVWLDEFELTLGDSLRRSIDKGLARSRFGIVILSPDFLRKEWPKKELDALVSREDGKEKVILPVWHNITKKEVVKLSPLLADKLAASTDSGIDNVAQQIFKAVKGASTSSRGRKVKFPNSTWSAATNSQTAPQWFANSSGLLVFRDVDELWSPEMVVIPTGNFLMGSPWDEEPDAYRERPRHLVTIGRRFAMGRYAVTFDEYDFYCGATNRKKPADAGWGRGRRPVGNVSWRDAQDYLKWLARMTGKAYRLPSEAEWEYACRAGTTTRYSCGDTITPRNANYAESKLNKTTEVGAYPPNPWGLCDMHGNVWEWVEDATHANYYGAGRLKAIKLIFGWEVSPDDSNIQAPKDGSAWTDGEGRESSRQRILRGGGYNVGPEDCRSASRGGGEPGSRFFNFGFRVARTID